MKTYFLYVKWQKIENCNHAGKLVYKALLAIVVNQRRLCYVLGSAQLRVDEVLPSEPYLCCVYRYLKLTTMYLMD